MRLTPTKFSGLLAAFALALILPTERASGTFIINSWSLNTGVENLNSGQHEWQSHYDILNPLLLTQTVSIPPSFATTNYDIFWNDTLASFHVTADHAALDVPPNGLFARSSGIIFVQPSVDSILTVAGHYHYSLPPNLFFARLTSTARDMDTAMSLWGQSPEADSFGGSFASGTLNVATPPGGILLPAGHTIRLRYEFYLTTFGGGTNAIGTANGAIQLTLTAIPEPAALGLLTFATLPLTCRRGRCCAPHHRSR